MSVLRDSDKASDFSFHAFHKKFAARLETRRFATVLENDECLIAQQLGI